ncbi:hypothetical protein GCM10025868_12720 [Angustibacter aerolatus]|uniref:Glycosyltransferase RgtA/B/C/D-like domain-containing protein n=1 Tax=Angustibacter aerolatus TaxID=1162965 RepID=A0ABQ6JCW2_9ACTN|nr:hypothetical protein [Angustibacter aerolatus]GMA86022.1 hypothetical protein GCM10025868_12720 [Angustibacter aerolatus]
MPLGPTGAVQQNAWAFLPGFPMSTRAVMAVTGLDFGASAVLLNVVLGGCAVVVVHRLVRLLAGRGVALAAVVLLCTLPPAPVLQIAYSETLGLLLLALALLLLVERRYRWCAVVVLVLSLSRPVVAPFALVVLAHLVARWRARGREPFPRRQRVEVVGLGLLSAASSLLWPVLVGRLTGVPDAYQRTQGTWRSSGTVEPVTQTLGISRLLWGEHGPWLVLAGTLVLLAVVATPLGRPAGPEPAHLVVRVPAVPRRHARTLDQHLPLPAARVAAARRAARPPAPRAPRARAAHRRARRARTRRPGAVGAPPARLRAPHRLPAVGQRGGGPATSSSASL